MTFLKLPFVGALLLAMTASNSDMRPGQSTGLAMARPLGKKCSVTMKNTNPELLGGDTRADGLAVVFDGYTVNRGTFKKFRGIQSLADCFDKCVENGSCKTFAYSSSKERCKLGKITPYDLTGEWKKNQLPRFCSRRDSVAGYLVRESQAQTSRVVWEDTDSTQNSPMDQEKAITMLMNANERTNDLSEMRGSIL
ncbi:hypothetical protein M9435_007006 [Picochlorum sp. BPE23]|nr:hypothetical protein M9435_007006 [Picochlorum sp. BPE23]